MTQLNYSAFFSLFIQVITGLIEAKGLTFNINPQDFILQDILLLELIVQIVEFMFYLYLVYLIVSNKISSIVTSHRYIDWSITTPMMLISFVLFFKYLKDPKRNIRIFESIKEEKYNILKILLANALMLLFGFLAERTIINPYVGVTLGFLPFAYMFKILYSNYAKYTNLSLVLHYIFFFIWGFYGVAAVLPFTIKNTIYNILDLFSKNAYGLFLYYFISTLQVK
jgi:bacteriorhodopsin